MWAQLIRTQVKPGTDVAGLEDKLRAAEQPDSGLLRTLLMRDQKDPSQVYGLVVFESEEKARARERDPRRQAALREVGAHMAEMYVAPPEFTDLEVSDEWTGEVGAGSGRGATTEHPDAAVVRSAYEALARGDMETFAGLLHEDIIWHESAPGLEGTYTGRGETLAFLQRVFAQSGLEMTSLRIHDVLASDDHVVILHEDTMTVGDRSLTAQYADIYHVRDHKLAEHWHLAVDPKADEALMAGLRAVPEGAR
jgi:ketosteroid isomerase-like protein